jgi:quercetin 2,3-dioxygenase
MSTPTLTPRVDVRRADERFSTQIGWLDSKHSFSFGHHHDHENQHHGLLLVNNDDVVTPGFGFETHPHRDMEIVTWVVQGSLVHQDSTGHNGVIYPDLAQRMSAGTGILHSEKNDSWRLHGGDAHRDPVHFVQMWVVPDEGGITPGYEQLEIDDALLTGGLVPVPPAWPGTAAPPPSASATGTPRSTPPVCSPAGPSSCPRPRTCTCSSRAAP